MKRYRFIIERYNDKIINADFYEHTSGELVRYRDVQPLEECYKVLLERHTELLNKHKNLKESMGKMLIENAKYKKMNDKISIEGSPILTITVTVDIQ